jgi:hypothetical protein
MTTELLAYRSPFNEEPCPFGLVDVTSNRTIGDQNGPQRNVLSRDLQGTHINNNNRSKQLDEQDEVFRLCNNSKLIDKYRVLSCYQHHQQHNGN